VEHQERARRHNEVWLPWLSGQIAALGLAVWPSVGNFVLIEFPTDIPGCDVASATAHLERLGIIPRAISAYGLPNALRVTVGLEEENRRVVAALGELMHASRAA
jgi:histidinol-phosphate aminotransferase